MNNKNTSPTIEQSLKMIEDKLNNEKKVNKKKENNNSIKRFLSKVIKKNSEKNNNKKEDVILLTKKVVAKDKKENKPLIKKVSNKKINVEKKEDIAVDLRIKNQKNLENTTELAVIIKKLKNIRDKKINNSKKKNSKKINKEIKKLNEAIDLAENLFKKELLDL